MASPIVISPLRSRLALKAAQFFQRDDFICRRCVHQRSTASTGFHSTRRTPFLDAFKQPRKPQTRYQSSASPTAQSSTSPLGALSQSIGRKTDAFSQSKFAPSAWPEVSHRSVAYWLLGSAASVFGIVVFGGLTRLTESGLSITEWRPVTGSLPPRNEEAWEEEFTRYKLSPEFKMLNSRMNLEEFKQIYWMEWTHRLWGRVVGITFLLPTVYFVVRRRVSKSMALRLGGICGLIGFQGALGWWMVKSGLKDDLFAQGQHPRVSQYRLAAHLGTAFIAYLAMFWNGQSILRARRLLENPQTSAALLERLQKPELRLFKRSALALSLLIFTTAMSGALVAGLDAGLIYNDFPWMGQSFVPPKRELLDPFYSRDGPQNDLVWRNMLENPVLVQLDHRILATTTFCSVLALAAYARFSPRVRSLLPHHAHKGVRGLVHLVSLQVVLGISTLWYLVPTPLAAAHQAGALALLTGAAVLGRRLLVDKKTLRLVKQAAEQLPKREKDLRLGHPGQPTKLQWSLH